MVTTLVDLTDDTSDDEVKPKNLKPWTSKTKTPYFKKRKATSSYGRRTPPTSIEKTAPSAATETPKTDDSISL